MRRLLAVLVILFVASPAWSNPTPEPAAGVPQSAGVAGYYRSPEIHGDTIVFAAEGDLWRTTVNGGVAQRITTHPSEETDPVISPDGTTLAFTARYEGPAELYTMPLAGGVPTRQTYESDTSIATTWTPDGKLVYTTGYYATLPVPQLVTIDISDHTRQRIPLSTASEAVYDASGDNLYFVRPAYHNNVTKRYVGGTARDVWKFSGGSDEAVELTGDYEGESHSPMWWNGRVYFVTSEQRDYHCSRLYSVRCLELDGSVNTVGDFQHYESNSGATAAAKRYAKDGERCSRSDCHVRIGERNLDADCGNH